MQGYSPGPQIVESDAPHCCVQTAPFSGGAAFRAEISASSIRLRGKESGHARGGGAQLSTHQPQGVAAR